MKPLPSCLSNTIKMKPLTLLTCFIVTGYPFPFFCSNTQTVSLLEPECCTRDIEVALQLLLYRQRTHFSYSWTYSKCTLPHCPIYCGFQIHCLYRCTSRDLPKPGRVHFTSELEMSSIHAPLSRKQGYNCLSFH